MVFEKISLINRGAIINKILLWLLITLTVFFALGFVYLRGADQNWDLLNYHYYNGYALLHNRFSIDIAAAHMPSFFNPVCNVLAYVSLSLLPFPISAWVITAIQLLILPLIILLFKQVAGNLKDGLSCVVALFLCLLAPLWWSELGTTFYSSTTAPLVVLSLWISLCGVAQLAKGQSATGIMMLAGFAVGLAAALKLTNAIFVLALPAALIPVFFNNIKSTILCGLAYLIGITAGFGIMGWWNTWLFFKWESPLFPLYNHFFQSPYFELNNFRDMRWKFDSLSEAVEFLWFSMQGTKKTSEQPFADARFILLALLLSGILFKWVYKQLMFAKSPQAAADSLSVVTSKAFLWFSIISFLLWAIFFAYQRYLIPLEIVLGIALWSSARLLFSSERVILGLLLVCVVISSATLSVPDWGHNKLVRNSPNYFDLLIPYELIDQPADYLISGSPNSYILPFLNQKSRFFRIDFSSKVDTLIRQELTQDQSRPVRFLSFESEAGKNIARWSQFGFIPPWYCWRLSSRIDRYLVCEVRAAQGQQFNRPLLTDTSMPFFIINTLPNINFHYSNKLYFEKVASVPINADTLHSVGRFDPLSQQMISDVSDNGFLVYGPYWNLEEGKYRVTFSLQANGSPNELLAQVDINSLDEAKPILSKPVMGSSEEQKITLEFSAPKKMEKSKSFEFRVSVLGKGKVIVNSIVLERI